MARPSPAQLRARREFVRRFGHKGNPKKQHRPRVTISRAGVATLGKRSPWKGHIRRINPESEHQQHQKKSGWIIPVVLIGGAILLLPRLTGAGSLFGGGTLFGSGSTYTPVGTDATGRPIYAGAPGSVPPVGYVQTGVSPTGQPIYSYSGGSGNVLGTVGTVLGAGGALFGAIKNLFSGAGGTGVTGSPLPSGGSSVTSPDILTGGGGGGGFSLPDIGLPDLTLSSIGLPSWMTDWLSGIDPFNPVPVSFDMPETGWVPSLNLDLHPITDSLPDFSDVLSF